MNIDDFFPSYPEYTDVDFPTKIQHKKEFYDVRHGSQRTNSGVLNHQELIARFLSSHTLYDELFIFHMMGTGKSMVAITTIEKILTERALYRPTIKKALIIVKSPHLKDSLIRDIVFTHPKGGKYLPEEDDEPVPIEVKRRREQLRTKKNVSRTYTIDTMESFHDKYLALTTPDKWMKDYSNCVVVIDEVHNLVDSKMYPLFFQFLHTITNRKLLMMSASPMRNDASEVAMIMNLILPIHQSLPVANDFLHYYFDGEWFNPSKRAEFKQALIGRVSYFRASAIVPTFIGSIKYPLSHLKLYQGDMSDFQYESYITTYQQDDGLRTLTQQASLFVFPDGSTSQQGFDTYITKNRQGQYQFTRAFLKPFENLSKQNKLELIKTYSIKYYHAISTILSSPKQNIFVFSESIKGSGAIVFGLLLNIFKFSSITKKSQKLSVHSRYALLSDEIMDAKTMKDIITTFNMPNNKHGDYIQVLIGGRKVAEGFSFHNIQQIHILAPHWNLATIDQATGRGLRAFSHKDLPKDTKVSIFLHAATHPSLSWDRCIDMYMYKTSEDKDVAIKQIERMLKEIAFDCAFNYKHNVIENGEFGSRLCDYTDCLYSCDGIQSLILPQSSLDISTYQVYYSEEGHSGIRQILDTYFKLHTQATLDELLLIVDNVSVFELFSYLDMCIRKKIPFYDRYGMVRYLKEQQNYYFLVSHPIIENEIHFSYYSQEIKQRVRPTGDIPFKDAWRALIRHKINELCASPNVAYKVERIQTLPISIQALFLENAILEGTNTFSNAIIQTYVSQGKVSENGMSHTLLPSRRILYSNTWRYTQRYDEGDDEHLDIDIVSNPYKVYGRLENDTFILSDYKNVDNVEKIKKLGKVCTSFKKNILQSIIKRFNPQENVIMTKADLCKRIYTLLSSHDLILT